MIFTAVLRFRVAGLSHLPILSPTARARAYAGHSQEQWQRFYAITNKEGYLLHSKNTNWRWGTVPAEERVDLKDRVNAALKEEEVPEVDEFTLSWRMSRVFSWMQKQLKGEKPRRRWYKTDPNTTPISTTTTTAEQEEVS